MLTRAEVALWTRARLDFELNRIRRWLHQHTGFNRGISDYSTMISDYDTIQWEIRKRERLARQARRNEN